MLPQVWLPAIRAHSGTDIFTMRLVEALNRRGIRAEITWLPHRAEYVPWSARVPRPPAWANLVHISSWLPQRFIPTSLPLIATIHLVVHDPALAPYKSWLQSVYHELWIKRVERNVLSRARAVTAVSTYTGKQAQCVFDRRGIVTIPNWIDTDLFRPRQKSSSHRPFRLLYIGNWSRRKGVDLLPHIMRRLGPAFELHYTSGLRSADMPKRLPSNMIPLGAIRDKAKLISVYQTADALLFPSRLEGFGLAALEAQACGVPVIAANNSALPEVVADGESGILCSSEDIDAFVCAARTVADNPKLWRHMSDAGRERAITQFAESTAVARYIACYERAVYNSFT